MSCWYDTISREGREHTARTLVVRRLLRRRKEIVPFRSTWCELLLDLLLQRRLLSPRWAHRVWVASLSCRSHLPRCQVRAVCLCLLLPRRAHHPVRVLNTAPVALAAAFPLRLVLLPLCFPCPNFLTVLRLLLLLLLRFRQLDLLLLLLLLLLRGVVSPLCADERGRGGWKEGGE